MKKLFMFSFSAILITLLVTGCNLFTNHPSTFNNWLKASYIQLSASESLTKISSNAIKKLNVIFFAFLTSQFRIRNY